MGVLSVSPVYRHGQVRPAELEGDIKGKPALDMPQPACASASVLDDTRAVAVSGINRTVCGVINPDDVLERQLLDQGFLRVAGIDECGRGSAAGPASVGVVVVDISALEAGAPSGIRDSKMLTPDGRDRLVDPIQGWAVASAVAHSYPDEIDLIGINKALRAAARRALASVGEFDVVILDGKFDWLAEDELNLFDDTTSSTDHDAVRKAATSERALLTGRIRTVMRIGADRTCVSVAAASILAKVSHDAHMAEMEELYPGYGWLRHNGYLTEGHRQAIREKGLSPAHRRTWKIPD